MSDDKFKETMKDLLKRDAQRRFEEEGIEGVDQETFDKAQKKVLNDMFTPEKKSGCFIATATYGSYNSPEVLLLRKWRDNVLLKSSSGKIFVDFYYKVSPSIAKIIGKYTILKGVSKLILKPIINYVRK